VSAAIALVGGRGYTGAELLKLIARHPRMGLSLASSASQAGQQLTSICPEWRGDDRFVSLDLDEVGRHAADAWVLAVPNGMAAGWARAIRAAHPQAVILDLSADHRFDSDWVYGLPERFRDRLRTARLIANPGCYATGAQLALLPVREYLVGTPVVFGVSGYSGAGRRPSDKNDPQRLHDNLLPYSLAGHVHEREVSDQLGLKVRFLPHVAPFFRGISLTVSARVDHDASEAKLLGVYTRAYSGEPRVQITRGIPEVRAARGTPDVIIGGFAVDRREPSRFALVATLDNLAKGAATQALQNLNLALGFEEQLGVVSDD
jgi:N-acetyl-gamma-glutamyl-phosphate reductase